MELSVGDSLLAWSPELILSLGALVVLVAGVFAKRTRVALICAWVTVLGAGLTLWAVQGLSVDHVFSGLIVLDPISGVFRWIVLGVIGLVMLMIQASRDVADNWRGEYLGILLLVGVGLMLMAEANHLLMMYLAIELVSLGSYVLVALVRDARASEAALKYLLFGALSSGIMLFGMSFLFGITGTLSFPGIQAATQALGPDWMGGAVMATGLILAGLAFKISMVPFHMWTPDVYEGAPIPVAALLSVGPKAAGLALLLRFAPTLGPVWDAITPVVIALTLVTMTFGNIAALMQTNIKRLLAYSTIGQVGFLLIGVAVNTTGGLQAVLVYLVAYLVMNLGAFACVVAVHHATGMESLEAFRGLAKRAPALALCCTLFLLSLAGIPPLAGFFGKFLLFGSAIEANLTILAIAGILNSAIALYYYVNIIRKMYLQVPVHPATIHPVTPIRLAVAICGVVTVWFGVYPSLLLTWLGERLPVSPL